MIGTLRTAGFKGFFWVLICAFCLGGCAVVKVNKKELPPLLAQDEILRPYQKVATVEVHRKRWGAPRDIRPQDYSWIYEALREEASKIGADAVIYPEVGVEIQNYFLFPTSEMRGKGVAIKFQ